MDNLFDISIEHSKLRHNYAINILYGCVKSTWGSHILNNKGEPTRVYLVGLLDIFGSGDRAHSGFNMVSTFMEAS